MNSPSTAPAVQARHSRDARDDLQTALAAERLENAARINTYRLWGISAFFLLFILLGTVLGLRAWQGNLIYFGPYWVVTAVVFAASRRWAGVQRLAGLAIAAVDVPMIFLLQLATFPTSPSAAAVAGYNLGIYVLLVILSALTLDNRVIGATAFASAVFEGALQYLAGVSTGAIVSTFIIMAIAGFSCAYGSRRLVGLLHRVVDGMAARRQAERALDRARDELEIAKRETEIARQIQTALLPRVVEMPGFEVAAIMRPAEEVGGDYYDVRPLDDGGWVAIGDVSGHGLDAGLVMMMMQVGVASLVQETERDVAQVVTALNRVLYENVHDRMQLAKHATFSLLRLFSDGRFIVAGAHEPLFVRRKQTGACERIAPKGAWLGILPDIAHCSTAASHHLEPGDVLLLHTDGIPEAADASGELFGKDRLEDLLRASGDGPMADLCQAAVADALSFGSPQADDMTVVAIRRV